MNRQNWKRMLARMAFVAYLLILLSLVFGVDRIERNEYHYNLVLFSEIKRYFKYRGTVGNRLFVLNIIGNFVGFMPFGFLLPTLSKHKYNWFFATMLTFELSLFIETVQLVTKVGSFDVDDLLLNTLGGSVGYLIYMIYRKVRRGFYEKKK